jgi:hypothetical protein
LDIIRRQTRSEVDSQSVIFYFSSFVRLVAFCRTNDKRPEGTSPPIRTSSFVRRFDAQYDKVCTRHGICACTRRSRPRSQCRILSMQI